MEAGEESRLILPLPPRLGASLALVLWGWRELGSVSVSGWTAIGFLGLGASGLGYLSWYGALERVETSQVAAFLYLEPLVTLGAAVALLGEAIFPLTVAGGALVLVGVAVTQRASR